LNGEAYLQYRQHFAAQAPDGELAALVGLESALAPARPANATSFLAAEVKVAVAGVELSFLQVRVKFLRGWLSQLLVSLPTPDNLKAQVDAERAFDKLVKSRFPLLATKEGELVRLQGAISMLGDQPGEVGELARKLDGVLRGIAEDFASFSKRLLEVRAALPRA
ncbi:MAG: AAA family ATPase, partial [Myxococcaceae bacterium]